MHQFEYEDARLVCIQALGFSFIRVVRLRVYEYSQLHVLGMRLAGDEAGGRARAPAVAQVRAHAALPAHACLLDRRCREAAFVRAHSRLPQRGAHCTALRALPFIRSFIFSGHLRIAYSRLFSFLFLDTRIRVIALLLCCALDCTRCKQQTLIQYFTIRVL